MKKLGFSLLALFVIFTACGKNDPVRTVGGNPRIPPPQQGPGLPPFQPTMPPGYPPQYTPFLPVDNYMRMNPVRHQYWIQIWHEWRVYAVVNQCDVYDFPRFWYDFCQERMYGDMAPVYQYFDQNFYPWMSPDTQFYPDLEPNTFWSGYEGYPNYPDWDGCGDWCY